MIDKLVIYFLVYAVLGYISEVIYCSVGQRRLVNRGFLYGPWLPIYGFGGLMVVIFLDPVSGYPAAVFILAFLLTSVLEYFTSWALEKLFSVKLWDYSRMKVNINGRVCLLNSTLFGIMGLAAEYFVQPFMSRMMSHVPSSLIHPLAMAIAVALSVDASLSVVKMASFKEGLRKFREARKDFEERVEALVASGKKELAEELRLRFNADIERARASFGDRMMHITLSNPSMSARSQEIGAQLETLREWTEARRSLKRRQKAELKALDDENIAKLRKKGR